MMLWEKLMGGFDKEKLEEVAVLLGKVWLRMNKFVYENRLTCPRRLLLLATKALEEFKQANKSCRTTPCQDTKIVNKAAWVRPLVDYVKVNWDASLDSKRRTLGMGLIMRYENGEALLAVCDSKMNVQSAEVAEC